MFGKNKVAALVAEFLGAGVLTLLVLSVHYSTIGVPYFVAIAAGLAIALMMVSIGSASGGYFNPALTIGLWTARRLSTITTAAFVAVQLLGGWAAYGLFAYFIDNASHNPHVLQPLGGHYTTRILIAEAVGTAVFAFGFAAALYQRLTVTAAAAYAGLAFALGVIVASSASVGLLNPAVALGVRAWVWGSYVVGPVIGAVVGVTLYDMLFAGKGQSSSLLTVAAKAGVATSSDTPASKPAAKKKSSRSKK